MPVLYSSTPTPTNPRQVYTYEQRKAQGRFHSLILKKDGYKCVMCGRTKEQLTGSYPDLKMLIADHLNPKSRGGTDTADNGRTLCFMHNLMFGWRARYKTGGSEGGV